MGFPHMPKVVIPPLPGEWTYRYYYTDEYPFGRRPSRYVRQRRLEELGAWLAGAGPRRALEVGCGPAELTALLHRLEGGPREVMSLDIGRGFVPLARSIVEANGGSFRFVVGDAIRLPFAKASFDLVVTTEMIEHVPAWPEFLGEAARVLRPGGTLMISTPTRAGFHSWLKRAYQSLTGWEKINQAALRGEGMDYERFLSRAEVVHEAKNRGFILDDCKVKIFVFSFIHPSLFGLNRLVERIFENMPGLCELGVTRFYKFRKQS
jgi:SAM-dependent methyltransferase